MTENWEKLIINYTSFVGRGEENGESDIVNTYAGWEQTKGRFFETWKELWLVILGDLEGKKPVGEFTLTVSTKPGLRQGNAPPKFHSYSSFKWCIISRASVSL